MFNGEPSPASAPGPRNVVRSSSISGEICGSQQAGSGTGTTTAKKRRSSLGAKMVAIVGLTQWSKSTLQLPQPGEGVWDTKGPGGAPCSDRAPGDSLWVHTPTPTDTCVVFTMYQALFWVYVF
ncbi:regulating synaptic membrane exocytosis 3 [Rhinolophus ferrumequinum]|uniref:Regulating synaptic membrane exocytosis 3 n=1 Tax=Rhinolophus ferrumequinum TaxID=59479 RepID=A0A7J7X776_RHIFE|nr:regulating synaptic membrane exocytosis 3 [Rhinolophus ferrumequinum]